MKTRATFILSLLASSLSGAALAACATMEPAAFAQHFFEKHREFYHLPTTRLDEVVTPAFRRALAAHYRCIKAEGICHIDYDPWLGAQDGEIHPPLEFSVTARQGDRASVRMAYRFVVAGPQGTRHQVTLMLRAKTADKCWQVDDLITPLGDSLATRYLGSP